MADGSLQWNDVSWRKRGIKGAVELGVTKLPNLDPFDSSGIPTDHEIGSGDDDDEEWVDEQHERDVFTFSFDDEDFWKWKNLCNCLFYGNFEKILWRFRVTIQKLFIISDNATFEKEKFLNYK